MDDKSRFRELVFEKKLIESNLALLFWELETEAPKKSHKLLADIIGFMSMKSYNLSTSEEFVSLVEKLNERNDLTELERKEIELLMEEIDKKKKIPAEEYKTFTELTATNQGLWEKAKEENNFSLMAEAYKKVFEYNKKFATYRRKNEKHLYDVILNDYEKNMTVEKLDKFFSELKKEIVPLLKKIMEKKKTINFTDKLSFKVDISKQKDFTDFICRYLLFDFERGVLAESAHPFTINLDKNDVRITTKFIEDLPFSSVFSTIHELGHAIYEQQSGENLLDSCLEGGGTMGLHESQSRFFENIVGRNKHFWKNIYEDAKKYYPELKNISLDEFYFQINQVEPNLIRTEADELTYSLHIMVRYEIEKLFFENDLDINDLPRIWKEKMIEYLGVEPKTDAEGVMQDVHWPGGSVGYFPSYALGSAYASQIYYAMKKELDVEKLLEIGDIKTIKSWLGEKIHKYGKSKDTEEIIKLVTGEELNSKYYIEYLKDKYTEIYSL